LTRKNSGPELKIIFPGSYGQIMNKPQFETNIGTVLIVNQAIRSDGRHYIDFKGSGKPKGPLAEAMG